MVAGAKRRGRRADKGAVLIASIIILLFLSILGAALISYLYAQNANVTIELDSLKALYLAEAGISKSIYELRKDSDSDNNGVGNVLRTPLGNGHYKAFHNFRNSTITGVGEYNSVTRRIQIKYSAL